MGHEVCRMMAVLWTLLVFLGSVAYMLYMVYMDEGGWPGGDITKPMWLDEDHPNLLTPASWIYLAVWPVTYLFAFMWLGYGLSTLCRTSSPGSYLYFDPPFLPVAMYLCYSFARALGAFWLYMANEKYLWQSLLILIAMTIFANASLIVAVVALDKHRDTLVAVGRKDDIALTIAFVHNGIGMYSTWLGMASLQLFSVVMIEQLDVQEDYTCYITLSILLFCFLVAFFVDIFAMYQKTKYLFTPYIVVMATLAAIVVKNATEDQLTHTVNIFVIVVLAIVALCFLIKLIVLAVRERSPDKDVSASQMSLVESKAMQPQFIDQPTMMMAQPAMPALMPAQPMMQTVMPAQPMMQAAMPGQPMMQTVMPAQPMMQTATLPGFSSGAAQQQFGGGYGYATLPAQPTYGAMPAAQPQNVYANSGQPRVIDAVAEGAVSANPAAASPPSFMDSFYVASN